MIPVHEIKPGMAFDSAVYIDDENLLVRANEPIKSTDIEKLLKWGIREVKTDGKPIAGQVIPKSQTAASAAVAVDMESLKLHGEYDQLRKRWISIRNDLRATGNILQSNLSSLIDKKIFNNHEIIDQSQKIVSAVFEVPYYALGLQNLIMSENPLIHHAVHAAVYGSILAKATNLSRPRVQELCFSMLVMDVGMSFVPKTVRNSPTSPNQEDWKSIQSHPLTSYKVLVHDAYVKTSLAVVALQHHENFDGSGYPRGLRGNQIDMFARIASIADRYAALLEDRHYRIGMLPYEAMKVILGVEGGRFDPVLLRAFLGALSMYPTGSFVELSTGEKGLVLGCSPDKPLRPLIRILRTGDDQVVDSLEFIDLDKKLSVYIVKALTAVELGFNLADEI